MWQLTWNIISNANNRCQCWAEIHIWSMCSTLIFKKNVSSKSSFSVVEVKSGVVLIRITAVVSPDEHSFTWFSINHVSVSNLIIRILFLHLSISIVLYTILIRHITGDIERPLMLHRFMSVSVIKISLIYITNIRIWSQKYQHLKQVSE